MLIRFIHWLLGYTILEFSGGDACRFMNLMAAASLSFWSAENREGVYGLRLRSSFLPAARNLARRCDIEIREVERRGIGIYLRRLMLRPGLILGAAFGILLSFMISGRIWIIEAESSAFYTEEEILKAAEECGVYVGAPYEGNASYRMLLRLGNLDWLSVNRNGVFVNIALRDKSGKPEIEDRSRICNVIASESGRIVSARAEKGKLMCQVGSGVAEGEMLISGVWKDEAGNIFRSLSRGTIMAETRHSFISYVPKLRKTFSSGRITEKKELYFFGLRIPLSLETVGNGLYEFSERDEHISLCGVELPIYIRSQKYTELFEEEYRISDAEARTRAMDEIERSLADYLGEDGSLSIRNEEVYETADYVYVKWECLCLVNIAEEQIVFVR